MEGDEEDVAAALMKLEGSSKKALWLGELCHGCFGDLGVSVVAVDGIGVWGVVTVQGSGRHERVEWSDMDLGRLRW
ncbi:hypothetical protein MRB53_010131 [Persea americana]|uniref:Uncharacterized protein n=1 Tax=Persea americana TaxID=3435 RepID=A0ACC2LS41_PERAE|nr:hypothetical protein MRB53_010131 [Persea americana]